MIGKIEKLLNIDDYDLEAVFSPAVVNVLILDFVFTCTLLPIAENTEWWRTVIAVAAPIAAPVVLFRFAMHSFREVARTTVESILYRKDRLRFPTTSMLLYNDSSISKVMKKRVREDIKAQYNITLCTKAQENADEMEARRTAKDAVALIRKTVADNKDAMTRRKLIRYGMFRNFLGGSLFCLPLSVICWAVSYYLTSASNVVILFAMLVYFIIVIVDYFLTKSAAVDYAETLITTFDKMNHNETYN